MIPFPMAAIASSRTPKWRFLPDGSSTEKSPASFLSAEDQASSDGETVYSVRLEGVQITLGTQFAKLTLSSDNADLSAIPAAASVVTGLGAPSTFDDEAVYIDGDDYYFATSAAMFTILKLATRITALMPVLHGKMFLQTGYALCAALAKTISAKKHNKKALQQQSFFYVDFTQI